MSVERRGYALPDALPAHDRGQNERGGRSRKDDKWVPQQFFLHGSEPRGNQASRRVGKGLLFLFNLFFPSTLSFSYYFNLSSYLNVCFTRKLIKT
jgi:hypothetical protein